MLKGKWDKDDIRSVFVAGASWWEFHSTGGTMWRSDRILAEEEATKRYPPKKQVEPTASKQPPCKHCGSTGPHGWTCFR
jgi:hypothetical protein